MTTYRQELRDLPDDQSSETTYADITWPDKPQIIVVITITDNNVNINEQ